MSADTKPTKALYAVAVSVVASLTAAASDGHITTVEWLIAAGAALAAGGGVYKLTNAPKG